MRFSVSALWHVQIFTSRSDQKYQNLEISIIPWISHAQVIDYSFLQNRVRHFSKFFGHNPALIDHSELSAMTPSLKKLNNVDLCLWAIFDKYILHVIVTKIIYFVRYCNKRKSTKNWLEVKVNVVQIQKTWYPRTQLTDIYQLWKKWRTLRQNYYAKLQFYRNWWKLAE